MTRKLGCFLIVMTLAVSASAAVNPGTISGYVRNSGGTPQMGATVEVLSSALQPMIARTDTNGFYSFKGLLPGTYSVRVTATAFLPSLREKIGLPSGGSLMVNITLNTLFEALQLVPKPATGPEDQDDWKWTLRSVANRPVLRLADDGPLMVVSQSESEDDKVLKAKISFIAGSDGQAFSSPDVSTNFEVEQSIFGGDRLGFNGTVGYGTGGTGTPSAIFQTTYRHKFDNGSEPVFGLTVKRFATPELIARHSTLQAIALSMSDTMTLGNAFELNYGGEAQAIQFMGRATAFRPFATADMHFGKDTVLEYSYQTTVPNMRRVKGFDSAPLDLSESGPRVTLLNAEAKIERARHNEISVSHRHGKNMMLAAYYRDNVVNPVITGVGDGGWTSGAILPDVYGNTFNYNGGELDTTGMRLVYQRKITDKINATVDYSYGGVLMLPDGQLGFAEVHTSMQTRKMHSVAGKVSGTVPGSQTRWITSYRWTSGDALTPVDIFNVSAGQADPFLNVFIRQPIPGRRFIPAGIEALVDVRNLLAQGYRPVVGNDGQTVYLVQTARSIRGGLAFTF